MSPFRRALSPRPLRQTEYDARHWPKHTVEQQEGGRERSLEEWLRYAQIDRVTGERMIARERAQREQTQQRW